MNKLLFLLSLFLLFIANFTISQIPVNNLIGYYPFNGNANDESGNGYNGIVDGATLSSDRFGNINSSYSFDGVDDFITIPESARPTNNFTISIWFQTNQEPSEYGNHPNLIGGIGLAAAIPGGIALTFITTFNSLYFDTYDGSARYATSSTTTTWGTGWHHVVATSDGTIQELWLDGIKEDSDAGPDTIDWTSYPLFRLGYGYRGYFNGTIDDVRIYSKALSDAEILALYNEEDSNNTSDTLDSHWIREGNTIYYLDGKVGVGTTEPGNYDLTVNGGIRAKEIRVETGWADFVFEDNYKLLILNDLEKYIEENGCLPQIPDEDKVSVEGVSLGEINKLLLQKIEELSLYLIELKKENIKIKEQLKELKQSTNVSTNHLSGKKDEK